MGRAKQFERNNTVLLKNKIFNFLYTGCIEKCRIMFMSRKFALHTKQKFRVRLKILKWRLLEPAAKELRRGNYFLLTDSLPMISNL
jgi:hypothetical protein